MEEFLENLCATNADVDFNQENMELLYNLSRASYIVYSDTIDSADFCVLEIIAQGLDEALTAGWRSIDLMTQLNLYDFLKYFYRRPIEEFRHNLIQHFEDVQTALRHMIPYRA